MTIFFYKGLTRNPEIGNTPVWVLPNIWRLGRVRNTKFGTNVSNKMLLNAAKCQRCSLYRFWVIKGKSTGAGGVGVKLPPPSTQIRVKCKLVTTEKFAISNFCSLQKRISVSEKWEKKSFQRLKTIITPWYAHAGALFSCNTRFEIRLLPYYRRIDMSY